MAEYLSPGVYVEEFESGGKPMEGVGTSTAGFVGAAMRGPVEGLPQLVTNFSEFKRIYGGYLSESEFGKYRYLSYAVEHFFINGGSRCFISRVAPPDAKSARGQIPKGEQPLIRFAARDPGIWGNDIRIVVTAASKAKTQAFQQLEEKKYRVKNSSGFLAGDVVSFWDGEQRFYNRVEKSQDNEITFAEAFPLDITDQELLPVKTLTTCEISLEVKYDDIVELYENVSFNRESPGYLDKKTARSSLITAAFQEREGDAILPPFEMLLEEGQEDAGILLVTMADGSNGTAENLTAAELIGEDRGAGRRSGIQAFLDNDLVSLLAVPGVTDVNVQLALVAQCENLGSRFAVLDIPREAKKIQDVISHREIFDSQYAALYHPWLEIFDPLDKKNIMIPPSGSMLGVYARSDNTRGVHKAPANEVIRACVGLDCQFNKGEQDILNPKGVNLIRSFPGMGIRVWGARTVSSDGSWKYVNVRRLFIFVEESIKANTNWVVFEPNDESLWVRVERTIRVFLENLWRNGSLAGTSPEEAFFVNIGRSTMSQDDIDNGRLICVIGIAPVKPAEFVIFRISQKTSEAG